MWVFNYLLCMLIFFPISYKDENDTAIKSPLLKKPAILNELAKRIRNRRYEMEITEEELARKRNCM